MSEPTSRDPRSRRFLVWIGLLILVTITAIASWRLTSLRGLPDIGVPFDVAEFSAVNIKDEENAFVLYRLATAKYREFETTAPYAEWNAETESDRKWLESNREALDLWKAGTDRPRAVFVPPGDLLFDTNFEVIRSLRRLVQLAGLEGTRLEAAGDFATGWEWHRAALRCSRHCGQRGTLIERLVGVAMHAAACRRIRSWATNPKVDAVLLRKALDEFQQIDTMTAPTSDSIKAEYLGFVNTMARPEIMRDTLRASLVGPGDARWRDLKMGWLSLDATLLREPERSRRVLRLVVANWLAYCDLPKAERPALAQPSQIVYLDGGSTAANAHRLTSERLMSWFDSTILLKMLAPASQSALSAIDRERATHRATMIHLATELYWREHGTPPTTEEEIVGLYLKALPPTVSQ